MEDGSGPPSLEDGGSNLQNGIQKRCGWRSCWKEGFVVPSLFFTNRRWDKGAVGDGVRTRNLKLSMHIPRTTFLVRACGPGCVGVYAFWHGGVSCLRAGVGQG